MYFGVRMLVQHILISFNMLGYHIHLYATGFAWMLMNSRMCFSDFRNMIWNLYWLLASLNYFLTAIILFNFICHLSQWLCLSQVFRHFFTANVHVLTTVFFLPGINQHLLLLSLSISSALYPKDLENKTK